VSLAQLAALGLDRRVVARRVRAGRLHRVYRGVYAVGHAGLSREGTWLAAVLASGVGAGLSRRAAGELWRITRRRVPFPEVVVPCGRRRQGAIRAHASGSLIPSDVLVHRGIPVTTVARTIVDLGDVSTPHQVAHAIHEAAFRKRFNLAATRAVLARATSRRGVTVVARALELHLAGCPGTRSDLEDAFLALLPAPLPEPRVNSIVLDLEVDFLWPDRRLAVEVDGPGHRRPAARRDDARKDAVLRAAGYTVLRFTDRDLRYGADGVARAVQASHARSRSATAG